MNTHELDAIRARVAMRKSIQCRMDEIQRKPFEDQTDEEMIEWIDLDYRLKEMAFSDSDIEALLAELTRLEKLLHERTNMVLRLEGELDTCTQDSAATVLEVADELKRLHAIEAAAADFVTVATEDHDLSKPVVMPGEFDTLVDALKGTGE